MENTETPKDSNKLSWRDYLLIAGIIAVFYFFDNDHQDILNYPDYLMYWLVAAIAIALVVTRFRKFEKKYMAFQTTGDRLFYSLISLIGCGAGAWVAAGILLSPFNYYDVHVARQNPLDSITCNIDSTTISEKNPDETQTSTIYYHAYDKPGKIETHDYLKALAYMHVLHSYGQYRLMLGVHKGVLNTWWLDKWSLRYNQPIPAQKR